MISIDDLASLNAVLNGTSAVLLALGYLFIRRKKVDLHKACMVSAFVISTLFLVSYSDLSLSCRVKALPGRGLDSPRVLRHSDFSRHTGHGHFAFVHRHTGAWVYLLLYHW